MAALKALAGLHLPRAAFHRHNRYWDLCLPREGTSHGAHPRQSLFPKRQTSGSFSQRESGSPESSCWSSPSPCSLCTGTAALGICAFPKTQPLTVRILGRPYSRKGKRPAPCPTRKVAALKALAGLHLPRAAYSQAQQILGSLLAQRRNISRCASSAEPIPEKANVRLLVPHGRWQP